VFGWPAVLPAFAKAAWLGVVPEFNPFKVQLVSDQRRAAVVAADPCAAEATRSVRARGRLDALPPVLTFQSVVDFTVSTRRDRPSLYANLPANGSELVLFDFNRSAKLGLLIRPAQYAAGAHSARAARNYRTTVDHERVSASEEVVERVTEAGRDDQQVAGAGLRYRWAFYSLSHLALTFPVSDPLYGMQQTTARTSASTSARWRCVASGAC